MFRLRDERREMFDDDAPNGCVVHRIVTMDDPVSEGDNARQFDDVRGDGRIFLSQSV